MGRIHVLDLSVANLIAAGEVVERPASAVKELVENAIDAGSTAITIEIQKGGIALMRVTDNGHGMSAEDAVMAIRRHATSKIRDAEDLAAILTLGFRGEALAAITSVCAFRIMTKPKNEEAGTLLTGAYGTVEAVEQTGCPDGTTVICERLFATTPARLKFLKSDSSEGAAVAQAVEKLALSHPEVAMKFISDGNLKFSTTGDGNLKNAIYSVYGGAFAGGMIETSSASDGIAIRGYISSPNHTRGNRSMQQFFINSRCVRSKTLSASLEAAYRSYIPSDKFPSCVLHLTIPAALVDVNIHPAKMEVKFSNEKAVFDALYSVVRGTLAKDVERPGLALSAEKKITTEATLRVTNAFVPQGAPKEEQTTLEALFARAAEKGAESEALPKTRGKDPMSARAIAMPTDDDIPVDVPPLRDFSRPQSTGHLSSGRLGAETSFSGLSARERLYGDAVRTVVREEIPKPPASEELPPPISESTDAKISGAPTREVPPYRLIGEAFASYILIETEGKLILIDKHAAHERINFERLRAGMTSQYPSTQLLLVPEPVALSAEEMDICHRYRAELESVGFAFSEEPKEAVLTGIPQDFSLSEAKDLFLELLTRVMEDGESIAIHRKDYFERALYQSACKASVKAGRVYDEAHIRWICDNLLRYDCIKFCPHGRPVAFEISKKELDSRFGRT